MKKWFAIAVCAALVMAISACSPGAGDGKVQLTFWVFGSTGYDKLVEEYMKENPDVKIKISTYEFGDHHNNLFTALSTGSGAPDLAMVEVGQIDRYRDAQDKFHNLYDYGAADVKEEYLDWKWRIGESADGEFLFGLPTDIGPTAMYYRKDVFEEAGLPSDPKSVSELTETWDKFEETAKTIVKKTGKPMTDNIEITYNARLNQFPEQYFNEDEELIIEDSPYAKQAYDHAVQMIQQGLVGSYELWSPEWGAAMNKGEYAALLGPSWMQGVIKGNAPGSFKWLIAPTPEGAGNWGGSYITIPKQTSHPEEAYRFAEWLVSPDNQYQSFKGKGLFPSAPAVYERDDFKETADEYFGGIQTAQLFAEAAEQVKPVYTGKNYLVVQEEIVKALTNVQKKKADPEKEWKAAVKRIKGQLDKQ
ncbi:ABC transporter substrate-binding protein [Desmospora profundinema]|uniref:Cellobiose transport system substrate-binding protein n=1 Tax=Desmospora profundinema TaxID=1571184 RepID=A0ABU1ISL1_9BACL|nr:ABC transporter substrate-binding protein [Desmospora profundinema]MDR6226750.1 cellobiose transport system substrate-binding protein [Desmospora profundinema]